MDKIHQAAQLADQCVKCGLCLQFCPTFQASKEENESPRGRISIIQGLAHNKLNTNSSLTKYLDHCLQCRTCERVCPSNVEYGKIIKLTREHLSEKYDDSQIMHNNRKKNTLKKSPVLLRFIIQSNLRITITSWLLWLYQKTGVQKLSILFNLLGLFKLPGLESIEILNNLLPQNLSLPKKIQSTYQAIGNQRGEVIFFPGCINKTIDLDNCHSAINLLQHYGFKINISQQPCCGALDELSSNFKRARSHELQAKLTCQNNENPNPILTLATGCLAHIKLAYNNSHSDQYHDLLDFLARQPIPENIEFKPLNKTAVIHQPCTQRNALKLENPAGKLLANIPKLKLNTPKCKTSCCGSAGDYSLKFQSTSEQLAHDLTQELIHSNPELLITSNIGCSLQLQKTLKQLNSKLKVVHPVKLLSQQVKLKTL